VDHCLTKAASSGYKTLAFPALGTGRLQYNKRTVANAMFDAVEHYSASNPSSPITDALFVVIPVDTDVVQEFENRCKRKNTNRNYFLKHLSYLKNLEKVFVFFMLMYNFETSKLLLLTMLQNVEIRCINKFNFDTYTK